MGTKSGTKRGKKRRRRRGDVGKCGSVGSVGSEEGMKGESKGWSLGEERSNFFFYSSVGRKYNTNKWLHRWKH
jgi:hypothetical protein